MSSKHRSSVALAVTILIGAVICTVHLLDIDIACSLSHRTMHENTHATATATADARANEYHELHLYADSSTSSTREPRITILAVKDIINVHLCPLIETSIQQGFQFVLIYSPPMSKSPIDAVYRYLQYIHYTETQYRYSRNVHDSNGHADDSSEADLYWLRDSSDDVFAPASSSEIYKRWFRDLQKGDDVASYSQQWQYCD
jgi:hypothetical protein